MKKVNANLIYALHNDELKSIVFYWDQYDPQSVLNAYAELKRREYSFSEKILDELNKFCSKHDQTDINTFLDSHFKEKGFANYQDYKEKGKIDKKAAPIPRTPEKDSGKTNINRYRYPGLRTIAGILEVFAYISGILIFTVFVLLASQVRDEMSLVYGVAGFALGGFVTLFNLAVAESIKVFLDIEYNTRKTAQVLEESTKK